MEIITYIFIGLMVGSMPLIYCWAIYLERKCNMRVMGDEFVLKIKSESKDKKDFYKKFDDATRFLNR